MYMYEKFINFESCMKNYLIVSNEELNEIIEHPPHKNIDFFGEKSYRFSNIGSVMEQYYKYYEYEYYGEDEFEKREIDYKTYDPKKGHKLCFDIDKFLNDIDPSLIKRNMIDVIDKYRALYLDLFEKSLLKLKNDLQIGLFINEQLDYIQKSIDFIISNDFNKLQKMYLELLHKSIEYTYNFLKSKYAKYINTYLTNVSPKNEIEKFILPDELERFSKMEFFLIENGFITYQGGLLKWNGKKTELVKFGLGLEDKRIKRPTKKTPNLIRFLEEIYNIDTGDLKKPSKYEKYRNSSFMEQFPEELK